MLKVNCEGNYHPELNMNIGKEFSVRRFEWFFLRNFHHFRSPVYRRRIKRRVAGVATFLGYANDRRNRRTWCIGACGARTEDGRIAPEDWPYSHRGRGLGCCLARSAF